MAQEYTYARHLSSALSLQKIIFYKQFPQFQELIHPEWKEAQYIDYSSGFVGGVNVLQWLEEQIRLQTPFTASYGKNSLQKISSIVRESVQLQSRAMFGQFPMYDTGKIDRMLRGLSSNKDLVRSYLAKHYIIKLHYLIQTESSGRWKSWKLSEFPHWDWSLNCIRLGDFPTQNLVITYDTLLCVLDKIEAEHTFLLYCQLVEEVSGYREVQFSYHSKRLYKLLDAIYSELGNEAIRVFKLLEPITIGLTLKHMDPTLNSVDFLDITINDVLTERSHLKASITQIMLFFEQWIVEAGDQVYPYIIENYGQEKMHFYPFVLTEAGMVKMYKVGVSYRPIDGSIAQDIKGMGIRSYVTMKYKKEHSLPPILYKPDYHPALRRIIQSSVLPSLTECKKIPLHEWAKLQLLPHIRFNYRDDPLDLLDDKSITPDFQNLSQLYHPHARKAVGLPPPPHHNTRRLIEYLMQTPEIDIAKLYDNNEQQMRLAPHQRLIIGLPKEQELKVEPRIFSILHPEVRLMASALEYNISKSIFPFHPQQTMTLSGAELAALVDQTSSLLDVEDLVWVHFHLDFAQWNYTFRERTTIPTQEWLNDVFGVRHFYLAMVPFHDAVFVSGDSYDPPGLPNIFNNWSEFPGGNQGICQKLWTLITSYAIMMALDDYDLEFRLMGSGDNQVLSVRIRKYSDTAQLIITIRAKIQNILEALGLELKTEETWVSSRLLCYQRRYYLDGKPISVGLKIVTKGFAGATDISHSVTTHVNTSMGIGTAMAEAIADPALGCIIAYLELYTGLLSHPLWVEYIPNRLTELVSLSLLGSDMGMLPILPLGAFSYAGHKDHLSESLAVLRKIFDSEPEYRPHIVSLLSVRKKKVDAEALFHLVLDPTAPNIVRPPTAESFLKEEILDSLQSGPILTNRKMRASWKLLSTHHQHTLAIHLLKLRPLNLSLIHSLFEVSHIGQALHVVNRFTKISTVVRLVSQQNYTSSEMTLASTIYGIDRQLLAYVRNRTVPSRCCSTCFFEAVLKSDTSVYRQWVTRHRLAYNCSYSYRLFLMSDTYNMLDVVMVGPFTPSPTEQLEVHSAQGKVDLTRAIVVTPARTIPFDTQELERRRGPFSRLIGSSTSPAIKTMRLVNLMSSDLRTTIDTLISAKAWVSATGEDLNLLTFIREQLNLRVSTLGDLVDELQLSPAGGCMVHRLGSAWEDNGAYNFSRSLISTWYLLSTNDALQLQDHSTDREVFFQQLYQFIFAGLRWCGVFRNRFYCEIQLDHCGYVISTDDLELPEPIPITYRIDIVSSIVGSPHLSLIADHIHHRRRVSASRLEWPTSVETGLSACLGHQLAVTITHYRLGSLSTQLYRGEYTKPQSTVNVSLVRLTPVTTLFRSLIVSLALHSCLGKGYARHRIRSRLLAILSCSTGCLEYAPFHGLLEALATAGKLTTMRQLLRMSEPWEPQNVGLTRLPLFIRMLLYALDEIERNSSPTTLVIELRQPTSSLLALHRFLRGWDPTYRKSFKIFDQTVLLRYLTQKKGKIGNLHVLLTSDISIVIANSRKLDPSPPSPPQLQHPVPDNTSLWEVLKLRPPIPWISSIGPSVAADHVDFGSLETNPIPPCVNQMYRWGSRSSGARLKLLEILARIHPSIDPSTLFISLAEGSGSMLSTLLHIYPSALGIYNSLLTPEMLPHSAAGSFIPPEFTCNCPIINRVLNLPILDPYMGDLILTPTWDHIVHLRRIHTKRPCVLTWDKEGDGQNHDIALVNLLEYLPELNPTIIIVKLFWCMRREVLIKFLQDIRELYTHLWVLKPITSAISNTEFYLIADDGVTQTSVYSTDDLVSTLQSQFAILRFVTASEWMIRFMEMSEWIKMTTPCLFANPDTGDPYHPEIDSSQVLLSRLYRNIQELWKHVDEDTGLLPRGTQHVIHSRAQGSAVINIDLYLSIHLYIAWFKGIRIDGTQVQLHLLKELTIKHAQHIFRELSLLTDAAITSGGTTRLWRRFGYHVHTRTVLLELGEMRLLKMICELIQILPNRWDLQFITRDIPTTYLGAWSRAITTQEQYSPTFLYSQDTFRVCSKLLYSLSLQLESSSVRAVVIPDWSKYLFQSVSLAMEVIPVSQADLWIVVDFSHQIDLALYKHSDTLILITQHNTVWVNHPTRPKTQTVQSGSILGMIFFHIQSQRHDDI